MTNIMIKVLGHQKVKGRNIRSTCLWRKWISTKCRKLVQ